MQILILFVVLAMIPGLLHAQRACRELQLTLHGYRVAEYGENYATGTRVIPSPYDSETCEKLRQDASVYRCRFGKAKATAESSARLANNMLAQIRRRMTLNPRQVVGGEAANRRVIRKDSEIARRAQARLAASRLEMEKARTPYQAVVTDLARNSCWHSFKGRADEDPVLKEHPLLDVVSRKAGRDAPENFGDALESAGVIK